MKISYMEKFIIFDFDGVLARSLEDNTKMNLKFNSYPGMTEQEIDQIVIDKFSQPRHNRSRIISKKEKQEILEFSTNIAHKTINSENTIFWKFINSIKKLRDCRFSIVSSGSEIYVKHFANQFDVKFDEILTIEDSLSKEEKVEQVCRNWNVDVKDCYYITDTVSDVLELREIMNPKNIYGCAWGWSGIGNLRKVLPDNQIFVEFEDILKCF
jgi:phosphoserine phosphatase